MAEQTLPSGFDVTEFDTSVRLQDDLYRFVNGTWLDATEIPADRARYGAFDQLQEDALAAVREILEGDGSDDRCGEEGAADLRKARSLYRSFMDEARAEALGVTPLQPLLAAVDGFSTVADVLHALGQSELDLGPTLIATWIDADPGNPEVNRMSMHQAGLGLPDEAYYHQPQHEDVRAKYRAHVARMLDLVGLDDVEARAERIVALETAIAAHHRDAVSARDAVAAYNLMPWTEAASQFAGEADLNEWIAAFAPAGVGDVVVRQPEFLAGVGGLLSADRLDAWRDWYRWHLVRASAGYLSPSLSEANFDFYGRTLTGQPQQRERWKRGVGLVESLLGEAVGREYVARHFPPAAKQACDALVQRLIEAYAQSIRTLDWLGEATKERALEKLSKFTPKIGHPDRWRDYSALEVVDGDLFASVRAGYKFEARRQLAKLDQPVDRGEWHMYPQTVNAYYNPVFNEIVFPAAILQPPFFDAARDAAANYGGIGAVIGHELSHGFDDQGSRYDGDGKLTDWWTDEDRAAFDERAQQLIAQYSELEPAQTPGQRVNGGLTVGENIADISGLSMAWKAYLLSLDGQEPPVIDGLSGAERFVLAWGMVWRQKARDQEVARLLAIDPHSPSEFRCNQVVKNVGALYNAINLKWGDALWMDSSSRVSLW